MTLVRRRVVNPAPPVLALVNGSRKKRGTTMATRKRKGSSKRRTVRARARTSAAPLRRQTKRQSTRRHRVYARRSNPVNPVKHRRRNGRRHARRSNPVTGVLGRAVPLVLGSAAIGFATPFVGQFVVRFAPQLVSTPIGMAGVTFGTGWVLSAVAGMFAFTRRWKDDILLAGAVLAGGQLFSAYVAPAIRIGGQGGNGMGRRYYRNNGGMSGLGVMTGIPPNAALAPPTNNNQGMQGVGMRPGNYAN